MPNAADHLAESTFLTAAAFTVTPPPPANPSEAPASKAPHQQFAAEI